MKKILDLICVIMFFTIIIMFMVSTLFFRNARRLAPTDTAQIDKTIDENFPLQGSWHMLRTSIMLSAGKTEIDGTFLVNEGVIKPSEQVSSSATERLSDSVNSFSKNHGSQSVYICITPSPSGIYSADIPSVGVGFDQRHYIDGLYNSIDSSVITLDAYSPLYASRENYIYLRTDESLTSGGAYDIYYSIMRKMGFSPRPYSDYDSEHAMSGYIGSLCTGLNIRQRITPDNIDLLIPKNGTVVTKADGYNGGIKDEYRSVFDRSALSGESPLDVFVYGSRYERVEISTVNRENPRLLIVKTGRTNPILPFIVSHYSTATVIDAVTASGKSLSELTDASGYDQILFLIDIDNIEDLELDTLLEE